MALLRLDADGLEREITPFAIESAGVDERWIGERAELAGFGIGEDGIPAGLSFAVETITEVSETTLTINGLGRSGACRGDSGGPLLVEISSGNRRSWVCSARARHRASTATATCASIALPIGSKAWPAPTRRGRARVARSTEPGVARSGRRSSAAMARSKSARVTVKRSAAGRSARPLRLRSARGRPLSRSGFCRLLPRNAGALMQRRRRLGGGLRAVRGLWVFRHHRVASVFPGIGRRGRRNPLQCKLGPRLRGEQNVRNGIVAGCVMALAIGCSDDENDPAPAQTGGAPMSSGGATLTGGIPASGGSSTGGAATGGTPAGGTGAGGRATSGGKAGTGGRPSGGASSTGGAGGRGGGTGWQRSRRIEHRCAHGTGGNLLRRRLPARRVLTTGVSLPTSIVPTFTRDPSTKIPSSARTMCTVAIV